MIIYLVARYSRREELLAYRSELEAMGHSVNARWLNGSHQISNSGVPISDSGELLLEGDENSHAATELRQHFAYEDYQDCFNCEMMISFTEPPRSDKGRGGRHVEFGVGLALMKRVWVVGHRENIFHWLEDVRYFETWDACKSKLLEECHVE